MPTSAKIARNLQIYAIHECGQLTGFHRYDSCRAPQHSGIKEHHEGMIVLKFGGTSVQNAEMMDATLSIVEKQLERAPVLVSSAMSKVTDQLQEIARLVGEGGESDSEAVLAGVRERHIACARSFLSGTTLAKCEQDLGEVCAELRAIVKALVMLKE